MNDRSQSAPPRDGMERNVGAVERGVSAVAGALISAGASRFVARRPAVGIGAGIAGALLLLRGATGRCALYRALGITVREKGDHRGINIHRSIVVNREPLELYRYWRSLEHLPAFMTHIESVEVIDARRSRWTSRAPLALSVSWEAEITAEREGEYIAWKSLPGSNLENLGSVRFLRVGPGRTRVRLHIRYNPPAGMVGDRFVRMLGPDPEDILDGDLARFKELMESDPAAGDRQPRAPLVDGDGPPPPPSYFLSILLLAAILSIFTVFAGRAMAAGAPELEQQTGARSVDQLGNTLPEPLAPAAETTPRAAVPTKSVLGPLGMSRSGAVTPGFSPTLPAEADEPSVPRSAEAPGAGGGITVPR